MKAQTKFLKRLNLSLSLFIFPLIVALSLVLIFITDIFEYYGIPEVYLPIPVNILLFVIGILIGLLISVSYARFVVCKGCDVDDSKGDDEEAAGEVKPLTAARNSGNPYQAPLS